MVTERFFQNILRGRRQPEDEDELLEDDDDDDDDDDELEDEDEVPGIRSAGNVRLDIARFTLLWKNEERERENVKDFYSVLLFLFPDGKSAEPRRCN